MSVFVVDQQMLATLADRHWLVPCVVGSSLVIAVDGITFTSMAPTPERVSLDDIAGFVADVVEWANNTTRKIGDQS